MASIERRGGKWRARWYEPGGKHRSKTFDRKGDAERWLTKVGHDLLSGAYVDPSAGRMTFKSYAETWRASKQHRPSTAAQVESHFRIHVYPAIGDVPIGKVRPADIQVMVNSLSERLAASTVETVYVYTANVFKRAVRDRLIPSSPCLEIELPRKGEQGPRPILTTQQIWAVVAEISTRYKAFVWICAGAGLRPSETAGLRIDRVDFLRRTIHVDAQLFTPVGEPPRLVVPKTAASVRTVPVGETIINAISAHLANHGPGPDGLVLSTREGSPQRRSRVNSAWSSAARRAGLPFWATPHDLRHYYASLLIRQGLDVKTVQRRLGHRSAMTTLDIYAHLWPDDEDRTRDAVELELGRAAVPVPYPEPSRFGQS